MFTLIPHLSQVYAAIGSSLVISRGCHHRGTVPLFAVPATSKQDGNAPERIGYFSFYDMATIGLRNKALARSPMRSYIKS
jgi:hypothetical protein